MAFNLLNEAWGNDLELSTYEQIMLARLACLTDMNTGIAWKPLDQLARETKMTKEGAFHVLERLTSELWAGAPNPKYCVTVVEKGTGRRATRYRVLRERLRSGQAGGPVQETLLEPVAVSPAAVAVSLTSRSGQAGGPDPLIPKGSQKSGAGAPPPPKPKKPAKCGKTGRTGPARPGKYDPVSTRLADAS